MLRFPLAIMVVFIHSFGYGKYSMTFSMCDMTGMDFYNSLRTLISIVLGHIAVPLFFLFSGVLFFQKLEQWDWKIWKEKMKRRVWSLFVPFIIWNIIRWIFEWSDLNEHKSMPQFSISMFWHSAYVDTRNINWLGTPISMSVPLHVPFWFIRDLLVLNILTPFIYLAVRRLGAFTICFLTIAFLGTLWPTMPGTRISAVYFFTLGAWISISGKTPYQRVCKWPWYTIIPPPPSFNVLTNILWQYKGNMYVLPAFICSPRCSGNAGCV